MAKRARLLLMICSVLGLGIVLWMLAYVCLTFAPYGFPVLCFALLTVSLLGREPARRRLTQQKI